MASWSGDKVTGRRWTDQPGRERPPAAGYGRRWQDRAEREARVTWSDAWRLVLVLAMLFVAHRVGTGAWWLA